MNTGIYSTPVQKKRSLLEAIQIYTSVNSAWQPQSIAWLGMLLCDLYNGAFSNWFLLLWSHMESYRATLFPALTTESLSKLANK